MPPGCAVLGKAITPARSRRGFLFFGVPARLQRLTGRSDNKSLVRGGCPDQLGGGRDHGNSHFSNRLNLDAAPVWADTSRPGLCQRGMTMYRLADVDFSNRLGIVVSELAPEEVNRQDQTLGGKATRNPATASSGDRDLEMAVFGAL